ncbi:hypothetical protein [Natrinema longum]|uniref:Uncharacterized protein n=1 Tax=Natrinema longum TaxID=370324 RepID=A0A8A2U7I1_9EURY|nr:hypothetical protein [Natrinema longum]MBZ6494794.1 hypothetical protein [Natrinema longum]QSW83898.1 hypothetical protein J0X27_10495 [Natrinema longum]
MSDEEHREFMIEMADKYGDRKALDLVPRNTRSDSAIVPASLQSDDVEIAGKNPATDPGEIKWSDRDTLKVKSPGGGTVVEADCYAARYKTGVYNEEGDEYYMYWMWMSARSQDHSHYTGNALA